MNSITKLFNIQILKERKDNEMRISSPNNSIPDDVVLNEVYKSVNVDKSFDDVIDTLERELINAKKNRVYMKKDFMDSIAIATNFLKASKNWKA